MVSLRRLLTPFFKATHPDLLTHASTHVKRTNERSLQQLNTIIDTLEHLLGRRGGGGSSSASGRGDANASPPHLESSYELTFHLVLRHSQEPAPAPPGSHEEGIPRTGATPDEASAEQEQQRGRHDSWSFTARLLFPATTVARFQREASIARQQPSEQQQPTSQSSRPPALPEEVAHQLCKLFRGAKLQVPKELADAADDSDGSDGRRSRQRRAARGGMMGAAEAEKLLVADLMGRDLRVQGPTPAQRRAAVRRWLQSGRVLTKGLAPAAEVGALRQLEAVLVQEWDRAYLDVAAAPTGPLAAGAAPAGGEGEGGVQILLDAGVKALQWEVLGDGRGHLLIVPAEDVKGSRHRLAAVLRQIGQRAMATAAAGGGGADGLI